MAKIEELKKFYKEGKYREIIVIEDGEKLLAAAKDRNPAYTLEEAAQKLNQVAWAYYQLGEYEKAFPMMEFLHDFFSSKTEIGESSWRGLAHCMLQLKSDIVGAERIMMQLPWSFAVDNIRMNMFIAAVRKGIEIPVENVISMIIASLTFVPYATVNGHIINNAALVFHEARKQEAVKPFLPILPGLMEIAISIYESTGATKNHIAGAEFRASQICEVAGLKKLAFLSAQESVRIWRELVVSQDGARFQRNLEGAETQLKKLE